MAPEERSADERFGRRAFLAASVGVAAGVAGCLGSDDSTTPTGTSPEADPATPTTTVTATPSRAASSPTDASTSTPTPTATRTPTATTRRTTSASDTALSDVLRESPSSHVAPADGFTDVSWLDETDLRILRVTNLDERGEGSLRWAIEQSGPRLVVFEVGGVIDLAETELGIQEGRIWIAGQTAPSPGITVVRGSIEVGTDDCILQHVRSRPGDAGNESGWAPDAISTSDETRNNVIDHCTATWSVDEALSIGGPTRDTTVSNCMIAEALDEASHPKGPHGYGSLISDGADRVTLAGNLWAHNTARNPRLKSRTRSVVANNVMYHFDRAAVCDASAMPIVEGNAFLRGEPPYVRGENTRAFLSNNHAPGGKVRGNIDVLAIRTFWPENLKAVGGEEALSAVPAAVGARPADRDAHEKRVIRHLRERTGEYIDSQSEVGGYPDFETTTRTLDVPEQGSGLAEWLTRHTRAVELPEARPP